MQPAVRWCVLHLQFLPVLSFNGVPHSLQSSWLLRCLSFSPMSLQTLVCGLLGLPPVNGVLPQAPMHTRSLAHIPKRSQHKHLAPAHARPGDAALTVNGTSGGSEWTADSYNAAPIRQLPAVAAVTQSLSKLRLGRGADADRQELSTGAHTQHVQQQPEGVHAVTAALSHMHLDTAGQPHEHSSPFGTPRASAALQPDCQLSQQAGAAAASSPSAGHSSADGAVLRHRQRSLSPTGSQGVTTAAGSSAPQHRRSGPSLEMHQQQPAQGRGRLHPSGSNLAINTLPDSAAAELGGGGGKDGDGGLVSPAEQGSYLRLEVRV